MLKQLSVKTTTREEMVDITAKVRQVMHESKIEDGVIHIYCPHTTAGITINEGADPAVQRDMLFKLRDIIPHHDDFRHSEGNSDSHIKSTLTGNTQTLFIKDGALLLGTWQKIFFCEYDGPRNRSYYVKVMNG